MKTIRARRRKPRSQPRPATSCRRNSDEDEIDVDAPEWANGDEKLELPNAEAQDSRPPRSITVLLDASGDHAKDERKLKRIYNALQKYPGVDRFVIVVQRAAKRTPLSFPEQTTQICQDLLDELKGIVGGEAVIVTEDETS